MQSFRWLEEPTHASAVRTAVSVALPVSVPVVLRVARHVALWPGNRHGCHEGTKRTKRMGAEGMAIRFIRLRGFVAFYLGLRVRAAM
jgi:hypothetical protein